MFTNIFGQTHEIIITSGSSVYFSLCKMQSFRNCGGAFQLIPSMKRRSRSTWRNKASPPCRRRDQKKWRVYSVLTSVWFFSLTSWTLNGLVLSHEKWRIKHWILTFILTTLSVIMSDCVSVQLPVQKRKKQGGQRKRHFKTHNNHLAGVLEDYSEGVPAKKWSPSPQRSRGPSSDGDSGHNSTNTLVRC